MLAKRSARLLYQTVRVEVACPRYDRLYRPLEVAFSSRPNSLYVTRLQMPQYLVQSTDRLLSTRPLLFRAQQILLRHHLQDRPNVLRHASMHQDQARLQRLPRLLADLVSSKEMVAGQQPPPADSKLGISL